MPSAPASRRQKAVAVLDILNGLSESALRQRWAECYGHPPPPRLARALLLRAVAYHAQSHLLGGLNGHLRRRLATAMADGAAPVGPAAATPSVRLMPGTQLVREWQGVAHRVQVIEAGFEYQGDPYRSLSHIARQITGTSWSGPAFFGLKHKKPKKEVVNG